MSRKKTYSVPFGTTTDAKAGNGDGHLTEPTVGGPQPAAERALKAEPTHALIHTATPSTVRAINRSLILNLIRLHQPISRAELSQRTGIFRSNISDIVEELIEQQLVVEKRGRAIGPGRVPMLLSLNSDGARVLAVSVRPSETLVAAAGLTGRIYHSLAFETPRGPREFTKMLLGTITKFRERYPGHGAALQEIGIGVPGLVNASNGQILWLPALPEYSGLELAAAIEEHCGISTAIDNDSNLAALAELWSNETADLSNFVVVVIGDVGVGAGIVLNRELYRGHDTSFAAEFGHMIVDPAGPECSCGRRGCWELFVSDRATWTRYARAGEQEFSESRFKELLRLAFAGDKRAWGALSDTAKYLSLGLSNIFLALNPEIIIVAGQVVKAWDLIQHTVGRVFRLPILSVPIRAARPDIEQLYLQGAVRLALRKAFAKPKLGW
jgi:N-acetylglucosamine repressor